MVKSHEYMQQADLALAGGALTSPLWVHLFENLVQFYLLTGGAVLLTLRIIIALFDFHRVRNRSK